LCAFADDKQIVDEATVNSAVEELNWHAHYGATGTFRKLPDIVPDLAAQKLTKIELRNHGETISEFVFGASRVIVGRAEDNEIFIDSKFVSRHHAQIISDESGCIVEDLNSTNGIYIGNQRVKKYRLEDGDRVVLGVHELVYTDLRDAAHGDEESAGGGNRAEG